MRVSLGGGRTHRRPLPGGIPLLTIGLIVLALVAPLSAQPAPVLAKGAQVRVVIPVAGESVRHVAGTLVRLGGDSLVLAVGAASADTAVYLIASGSGMRLEQLVKGRGHPYEGVLFGAAAGALVGAFIGARIDEDCTGFCFDGLATKLGAGIGALGGGVVGALVGNTIRTKRWVPVSTDGLRISLAPRALSIRIAF